MDLEKTIDIHDKYITEDFGDNLLIVNYTSDILSKTESIHCIVYKNYFLYGKELIETIAEHHCEIGGLFLNYINLNIEALNDAYDLMCNIEIAENYTFKDLMMLFPDRSYPDSQDFSKLPKRQQKMILNYNYAKNVYNKISKIFNSILNAHPFFWDHIGLFATIRSLLTTEIIQQEPLSISAAYEYILMFFRLFKNQISTVQKYKKAVDFIICLNTNENLHSLSFIKRQYLYLTINDIIDESIVSNFSPKKDYDFLIKKNSETISFNKNENLDKIIDYFENLEITPASYITVFSNFQDVCSESLNLLIEINKGVKKCNYCSEYFFVKGNYESNYCDQIFGETNRTCQQLASIERYQDKVKSNPILKEYQKAYKRNYAKRTGKRMEEDEFCSWVDEATIKRDEAAELYNSNPDDQIVQDFKNYLGNK